MKIGCKELARHNKYIISTSLDFGNLEWKVNFLVYV